MEDPSTGYLYISLASGQINVLDPSSGQIIASIPVGEGGGGLSENQQADELFAANELSGNVSVVSTATDRSVGSIPGLSFPSGLAYDGNDARLFVAEQLAGEVEVVAIPSGADLGAVHVGNDPLGVAYDPATGMVYVANEGSANVSVLDASSLAVLGSVPVGQGPSWIAYDPPDSRLYVGNSLGGTVSAISDSSRSVVATIALGGTPEGLAYDPPARDVVVANSGLDALEIVNTTSETVAKTLILPPGATPVQLTISGSGSSVYVADHAEDLVQEISPDPWSVTAQFVVGSLGPSAVVYDSSTGDVLVADYWSSSVQVIAASSGQVLTSVGVGAWPDALAYDPWNGEVFVANEASNNVTVLNGSTFTSVASISVGGGPDALAFDPLFGEVYVANSETNNVSVIDPQSRSVVHTETVGSSPDAIAINPEGTGVFVANGDSNNVSVISAEGNDTFLTFASQSLPGALVSEGDDLIIAETGADNISEVDPLQSLQLTNIGVGIEPEGLAFDSADGSLFVSDQGSDNVTVVATPSGPTLQSFATGVGPWGVAFDPYSTKVYIGDVESDQLTYSLATGTASTGLTSVQISPSSSSLPVLSSTSFNATAYCGGAPCSGGAPLLQWSLSNSRGSLNTSYGPSVRFAAGPFLGSVALRLNATLAGSTVSAVPVGVTITPGLATVSVTPTSSSVPVNGQISLTASASCSLGNCPGHLSYSWSPFSSTLGSLNTTTGSVVSFLAGATGGSTALFVNATLNGTSVGPAVAKITILPTIASATIFPGTSTVPDGGVADLSATVSCSGGGCPTSPTFSWSLTNGAGTLNSTSGRWVAFNAGAAAGEEFVFVNATLDGLTVQSSPALIVIVPGLSSVLVSPPSAVVTLNGSVRLNASAYCTGGTCPGGAAFSWNATNGLGVLNTSRGASVTFLARSVAGIDTLFVNASLEGRRVMSAAVPITISTILAGVSSRPGSANVSVGGGRASFTALPSCTGGPCPSGISYTWNLSVSGLGSLNATSGAVVTFTSAGALGTETLFVNASFDGTGFQSVPIPVHILPALSGVSILVSRATVLIGGTAFLNASWTCTGGPCPTGTAFDWTLTNTYANLNTTSGSRVELTAGGSEGQETVFVNATLMGNTRMSPPATLVIDPELSTVTVSPTSAIVPIHQGVGLSASPHCTGGACDPGWTCTWTETNGLGGLNTSNGCAILFTAWATVGNDTLFVNVTLNGQRALAPQVRVTIIPSLAGVSVSPGSATVLVQSGQGFNASVTCAGQGTRCSPGFTFVWSLTNSGLGDLNLYSGPSVLFRAFSTAGQETLFVNATQGGNVTMSLPVVVSILPKLSSVTISPGPAEVTVGTVSGIFTAQYSCVGGTAGSCPSGYTPAYAWLDQHGLGTLSTPSSPSTTYQAGPTPGADSIDVTVTLDSVAVSSLPVSVEVVPSLLSLTVSPVAVAINLGNSTILSANAGCSPSPCPGPFLTYTWNTDPALGSLNSSSSPTVNFDSYTTGGTADVNLSVALGSDVLQAAATVQVLPILSSLTLQPGTDFLPIDGSTWFTATEGCTGGGCPTGTAFQWTLSNQLGNLTTESGDPVQFTAGMTPGTLTVAVTARLHGITQVTSVLLTVDPLLTGLEVTKGNATLLTGASQPFYASAMCEPTGCPTNGRLSYEFSIYPDLGELTTVGNSTLFTAGDAAGLTHLYANATLDGLTVSALPIPITILWPPFVSVLVSPTAGHVVVGGELASMLSATPVCAGGACAPTGFTFVWSQSKPLGSFSDLYGSPTWFLAGREPGVTEVFVNVTFGGRTVEGPGIMIDVFTPVLDSMVVSQSASPTPIQYPDQLRANPTCNITCPWWAAFSWTAEGDLGELNSTVGAVVEFTAGTSPGEVELNVTVSFPGQTGLTGGTLVVIFLPELIRVDVLATRTEVPIFGTSLLSAIPLCNDTAEGDWCPPSTSLSWSLSNALGSLDSEDASSVTFSAGDAPGVVTVGLSARLGGDGVDGAPVNLTLFIPVLSSVSISPSEAVVASGLSESFWAQAGCSGYPCPPDVRFRWTLTGNEGALNSSGGNQVDFLAGYTAGTATLTVNATSPRGNVSSAPVEIDVFLPALTSVSVTPSATLQIAVGATWTFEATIGCGPWPCPPGTIYTWSEPLGLGTLNDTTTRSTEFTAGGTGGTGLLTVEVVLNGVTLTAEVEIVVPTPLTTATQVLPFTGLAAGATALALLWVAWPARRKGEEGAPPARGTPGSPPPPEGTPQSHPSSPPGSLPPPPPPEAEIPPARTPTSP